MAERAFLVLGDQLFAPSLLPVPSGTRVFMREDVGLCTDVAHHQQKIALFLAAMRSHRDVLRERGFAVEYQALEEPRAEEPYEEALGRFVRDHRVERLETFEIGDRGFEARMLAFATSHGVTLVQHPSPMFITPTAALDAWMAEQRPHMAAFYRWQRRRLGVLLEPDGTPRGGQWSFDADNRKPLPRGVELPGLQPARPTAHVEAVVPLVAERFGEHPGELSVEGWWLPTTRPQALRWLRNFLARRFTDFGPYEDALSQRDPHLFHAVLTPALNMGLLTPAEVLGRALTHAAEHETPLQSVEGFVRQLVGWREFIRGIDRHYGPQQHTRNFFGHRRGLTRHWTEGTTGLPPLDAAIAKTHRWGWAHHIERLMVTSNLMTLCEIEPRQAYGWFMERFVDSAHWVMGPNVYGMGLFADGGVFATKPYICGSNYVRKMSDFSKGPWCDVMDGLYWRFIARNREFFRRQARLSRVVGNLDRMSVSRKETIFAAAETFIERTTLAPPGPQRKPTT
ncbi:MAG: cryptochrome/photolyase family protein [Myxococcota bacterium]